MKTAKIVGHILIVFSSLDLVYWLIFGRGSHKVEEVMEALVGILLGYALVAALKS